MIDARSNSYNIGVQNNKPYRVIVSFIALAAFIFNMLSFDYAWADRAPSGLTSVGPERAVSPVSPGVKKELNVSTFALPEYLGHIRDSWGAADNRNAIIHIQDAHCNYDAQKRIADIIGYIDKNYDVSVVNLEGGAKGYDLSIFASIDNKIVKEKTSDYFVKEGLINGAEYFAINNPEKITLWGIEDTALYMDNLKIYRSSMQHKEEVDKFLKSISFILSNLKVKIYSKELLAFDMKYAQYKANNIEFKEYLNYLLDAAKKSGIDIKEYRNIYMLNHALQEEAVIDFRRANNERDKLIDTLQKRLSKNAMEELVVKTVELKAERISQREFYAYLTDKARKSRFDLNDFPELQKYIVYIALYDAMDKMKIMDEIAGLEGKIKDSMFSNDDQKELARLSKDFAIIKNIFNITMTREDHRYYKANVDAFAIRNYKRFIDANAPKYKITARLHENIELLDQYLDEISEFYEYSFKRDDAFMKNILYTIGRKPRAGASILVTGGFHTENLCDKFRKEGVSYISIMPNFKNENGYESPYFKLLSGKQSEVINSLSKEASALALFTDFCKDSGLINGAMTENARALWMKLVAWTFDGRRSIVIGKTYYTADEIAGIEFSREYKINGRTIYARDATDAEKKSLIARTGATAAPTIPSIALATKAEIDYIVGELKLSVPFMIRTESPEDCRELAYANMLQIIKGLGADDQKKVITELFDSVNPKEEVALIEFFSIVTDAPYSTSAASEGLADSIVNRLAVVSADSMLPEGFDEGPTMTPAEYARADEFIADENNRVRVAGRIEKFRADFTNDHGGAKPQLSDLQNFFDTDSIVGEYFTNYKAVAAYKIMRMVEADTQKAALSVNAGTATTPPRPITDRRAVKSAPVTRTTVKVEEGSVTITLLDKNGNPTTTTTLDAGQSMTIIGSVGHRTVIVSALSDKPFNVIVTVEEGSVGVTLLDNKSNEPVKGTEQIVHSGDMIKIAGNAGQEAVVEGVNKEYIDALIVKGAVTGAASHVAPEVLAPIDAKALVDAQAKAARAVIADLNMGTADIIVMPGSDIYMPKNAVIARGTARKLHKDYGQDTVPYNYKYGDNWMDSLKNEILPKAVEELQNRINGGDKMARMLIYVPYKGDDDKNIKEVKDMVYGENSIYNGVSDMIKVVYEPEGSIPSSGLIDMVMHIVLGKGLLNYERYGQDMPPDSKQHLVDLVKLLVSNPQDITPDVIREILKGSALLKIKPVDFKEIDDWKKSQDALLTSL